MSRILVVDDTADMRLLMKLKLKQKFEVEIIESSSGHASAEVLLSTKIDLVVSDLQMPNGSGSWLHNFMRMHSPQVPLILFTATYPQQAPSPDQILKEVIQKPDFQPLLQSIKSLGLFHDSKTA